MRIVRGATSRIMDFSERDDGIVICKACARIIISRVNIDQGKCPFCHRDVQTSLAVDPLIDDDDEDIALPC